jgi:hypothetical protein
MNIRVKQHNLLKLLYNKYQSSDHSINKIADVDFATIYKQLDCTQPQYLLISPKLITEEEVDFSGNGMYITPKGIISYSDKKYVKEYRANLISRTKDYLGISLSIVAIMTGVITTTISIKNISSNNKQIERLNQKVYELEQRNKAQDSLLKYNKK